MEEAGTILSNSENDEEKDNVDMNELIVEMHSILQTTSEFSMQDTPSVNIKDTPTVNIKDTPTVNKGDEYSKQLSSDITQSHILTDDEKDTEKEFSDDEYNSNNFYLSLNIESESLTFNIQITTPHNQWTINKSFKDFQLFDSKLDTQQKFVNANKPRLPPLHETTIQSYLLYLTLLLNKAVFLSDKDVCEFIECPQKTIMSIKSFNEQHIPIKCGKVKLNKEKGVLILNERSIKYDTRTSDENDENSRIDLLAAVRLSDIEIIQLNNANNIFIIKTSEKQWKIQCKDEYDKNEWVDCIQKMVSLIEYCQDQKQNRYRESAAEKVKKGNAKQMEQVKDRRIDYEWFQWIFIIIFTLWTVIDRYTVNMWPLWVDSPGPTIPGNFGVSVFAVIAWVSSRMLIVSSSYIFLFQCHVFFNWVVENKLINKYIRIGDIKQSNTRLHYHVGWALIGIPVVLHVWSILFAGAFKQNSMKLYTSWMRPSNAVTGLNIPFYANNLLSLAMNDVYRLISTSLTFFVLIPYSVIKKCRDKNWSFAQWIHLVGATVYTVDLLRMKSHPHCWVFNIPFLFMWMCDRIYGIWVYRRTTATVVQKTQLDDQYVILYLRVDEQLHSLHCIGDVYYVNRLDCSGGDRAHPFTVFQNHRNFNKMTFVNEKELDPKWAGHKFSLHGKDNQFIMKRMTTEIDFHSVYNIFDDDKDKLNKIDENKASAESKSEIPESNDWNVGIIMQVMPNRVHGAGCYERKTWTNDLFNIDFRHLCGLRAWGPYRSEYRTLIKEDTDKIYPKTPLVLIASGTGCSYLIDYYQYIVANELKLDNSVQFYFTARSIAVFQWFTNITCSRHIDNFYVSAHLTSRNDIKYDPLASDSNGAKSRNSAIGRMSFQEILDIADKNTEVYFCGSPAIQNMVKTYCDKVNLSYHAGHSFHQ